ncbi:MAG TPA: uracil-DNA glycosylase [Firmicutes bacterium]|nr:uracil-DNA glycosylase [Bacillota bacterium]
MDAFTGKILPEDPLPAHLTDNQLRLLNSHTSARLIWGEGNSAAPLFIVLDNPGARETKEGKPFLCGTRETLLRGIAAAGLALEQVYVSFLLKARPLGKYDKEKARGLALDFLREQIDRHKPQIVICLGDVVTKAYFGDPQASAKKLRGKTHMVHGFTTIVSYHPLAVRRRPSLYKHFTQDLSLAAKNLE